MAKMTSLKLTEKEAKGDYPSATIGGNDKANLPRYPYGTKIRLETDALKKMKLDVSDFSADDVVEVTCKCVVSRASIDETQSGTREELELQITDIDLQQSKETKRKKASDRQLDTLSRPTGGPVDDED